MAKNRNDDSTVVNVAVSSVVGIQCGGDVSDATADSYPGGRWVDFEDMDRSLISNPDD